MSLSSLRELRARLRGQDITLWAQDGKLRYAAPRGRLTAELRRILVERKLELLEDLAANGGDAQLRRPPIEPRASKGPAPLSFAQQRIWFMDQLSPGNAAFNVPRVFRLVGPLALDVLQAALDVVLERHAVLRTVYRVEGGEVRQIVRPGARLVVERREASGENREERIKDALATAKVFSDRPFDLAADLVLRALVLRVGPDEHMLVAVLHHIVSDNWAEWVFFRELGAAYNALVAGRPAELPALRVDYADFSAWQRAWMRGEVLDELLAYWRSRLSGAPLLLTLPFDRPRTSAPSNRGAVEPLSMSPELTAQIKRFATEHGVTPFMFLLAVLNVVLMRYTNEEDIVVGSPIANRSSTETEALVGVLINTLVLRADCSGNPPFREHLLRVRDMALAAYEYQDIPFESLVEALQPERTLSYHPLVQVMLVFHNTPAIALDLTGIEVQEHPLEHTSSKFDLCLSVEDAGSAFKGHVEYSVDLFDRAFALRFMGHYMTLLAGFLARPNARLWDLEMVTRDERAELIRMAQPGWS
ncbi:MAG: condensation domain-containing protein [Polyangiaceae bacterium]|nr:condensation domain-containing protein [Polyangiaceae bacterium]